MAKMNQHELNVHIRKVKEMLKTWMPEHREHVKKVANEVLRWVEDERRLSSLLVEVPPEATSLISTMCDSLYSVDLDAYVEDNTHIRIVRRCLCSIIE